MASRKGITISGHYVVSIDAIHFHIICTLNSKKKERWDIIVFYIMSFKLNDHQTRCFHFG